MHSVTTSQRCWTCNCFFSFVTFNKTTCLLLKWSNMLRIADSGAQCNQGALPRVSSPFPGNQACFHRFISFQQPCCTLKKHLAICTKISCYFNSKSNPLIRSFLLKVPTPKPSPISSCGLWRQLVDLSPKRWVAIVPGHPPSCLRVSSHLLKCYGYKRINVALIFILL